MPPVVQQYPEIVYVDARVEGLPVTQQFLAQLGDVSIEVVAKTTGLVYPSDPLQAKRRWLLTTAPKPWFRPAAHHDGPHEVEPGLAGAAEQVLLTDFVVNTPYDCSYAPEPVLLSKRPLPTFHMNVMELLADLARRLARPAPTPLVVRCGALGDALAYDQLRHINAELVTFFAWSPRARLELWTRTANVESLLALDHRGQTTVVIAVTPPAIINSEERGTDPLLDRLAAARELVAAGYRVAYAIDPIIQVPGWEGLYDELIDQILTNTPAPSIERIELSCFHYPRGLTTSALQRFPRSRIFFGELVPVNGCYRYFRPVRQQMYDYLREAIAQRTTDLPVHVVKEHGLIEEMSRT